MAKDESIRIYAASDIEKYHKGQLSAPERHAMEKAALDDPFLADALEGYALPGVNVKEDLAELSGRLSNRTENSKVIPLIKGGQRTFPWLRAAAMIIVIAGAGILVYQLGFNTSSKNIAAVTEKETSTELKSQAESPSPKGESYQDSLKDTTSSQLKKNGESNKAGSVKEDVAVQKPALSPTTDQASTNQAVGSANTNPALKESTDMKPVEVASAPVKQEGNIFWAKPRTKKEDSTLRDLDDGYADVKRAKSVSNPASSRSEENSYFKTANTFRGRVTDAHNNPIPFANVTNTEDNVGTYADAKGFFNLTSPDSVLNVQVRGLGFNNNYLSLKKETVSNQIVLQEDKSLDEVVISKKMPNATSRARNANMKLIGEPEPEDGWENYDSYLANNLNVPKDYQVKNTGPDEVKVSFEVNKLGEPVNIKVEKSLCSRCDQEAIRLIKEGPKWKRKARKGRTTVTINF